MVKPVILLAGAGLVGASAIGAFAAVIVLAGRDHQGQGSNVSLYVPAKQPSYARKLDPQLAAFSIEGDHWPDWAGNEVGQPNTWVNTVLGHITDRTGAPVFLRVGANAEDTGVLDLSIPVINTTFPAPSQQYPAPGATKFLIGRDYYALSGNLPTGTNFHWGVKLSGLNDTETLAQAKHVVDSFARNTSSGVHLKLLEFGNEVDSLQAPNWGPPAFADKYVQLAKVVLPTLGTDTKLFVGSFAQSYPWSWNFASILNSGVLDDPSVRNATTTYGPHQYMGLFGGKPDPKDTGSLVAKDRTRVAVSRHVYDAQAAQGEGLDMVLSEMNSFANHGSPGLSNTAESALWAVDFMLLAASIGIRRCHFHNGRGYRYNVLQPSVLKDDPLNLDDMVGHTDRPHIAPLYYAFLIVGEAIGPSTTTSYAAELPVQNGDLRAYGIWEGGPLKRIVLINGATYLGGGDGRDYMSVSLANFNATGTESWTLKRFNTPALNASLGMTWAGQDFDTVDGQATGNVTVEPVVNGTVTLPSSSIAIMYLK